MGVSTSCKTCPKSYNDWKFKWGEVKVRRSASALPLYEVRKGKQKPTLSERSRMTRWSLEQELVEAEEIYLRNLQILEACYRNPMEDLQSIIGGDGIDGIFMNIEKIHKLHAKTVGEFKKYRFGRSNQFAKVCLSAAKHYDHYIKYSQGLEAALWHLYFLLDKEVFQDFLRAQVIEEDLLLPAGEFVEGLLYYLLLPLDHIWDVGDIFSGLVDNTSKDSFEYKNMTIAYGKVRMTSEIVNQPVASIVKTIKKLVTKIRKYGLEPSQILMEHQALLDAEAEALEAKERNAEKDKFEKQKEQPKADGRSKRSSVGWLSYLFAPPKKEKGSLRLPSDKAGAFRAG
ncbi:hypothetical protein AAMO2058_000952700 [Amorphochlora amoebiformis]